MSLDMNSNKQLLVLLASLFSIPTVVGCGGATEGVDPENNVTPAPSASSSSSSSTSQDDAGAPSSNKGTPAVDGGTSVTADAGATTTTTPSANCSGITLNGPNLCIENVSGHAGSIVSIPIDLLETTGCGDADEADGHLVLDSNFFQLANPAQQINCISRDLYAAPAPGTVEIMWDAFGPGQVAGCTTDLQPGRLDMVQVEILPGTPAGDYDVTWSTSDIAAASVSAAAACFMSGTGTNGKIHVD
jgi:hypothetical protein